MDKMKILCAYNSHGALKQKKKVSYANIENHSSVPISFSVSLTAHLSTFLILKRMCVKPRISCGYKEWGLIDRNKGQSK